VENALTYKGVVFNEMKGAYASPERTLGKQVQYSLFPDTIYRADSGGDPRHIPDLTYEQLREFHRTYYHPSNSMIFMYGDDDPEERLRLLDAYLSDFKSLAVDSSIPLQPKFDAPRRFTHRYAAAQADENNGNNAKKAMVAVSWLLSENTDPELTLGLAIMDQILVGTQAAPLRRALIDSGIGADLTGSGLNDGLQQMSFGAGLKGIAAEDAEKVETLILDTLEALTRDGIDPDTVEAAMNTVEFALRENNTGSFPRGLSLMLRSLDTWLYGRDPIAPLRYEAPLAAVKAHVAAGGYFERLIREHLLDNTHRTTVLVTPDSDLDRQEAEAERARLEAARAAMSEADLLAAVESTHRLRELQGVPDPPEVLGTLPALALNDLDKQIRTVPIEVQRLADTPILYHDLFTNGIIYLEVALDLRALPQDLLPYVSLFGRALLEIGTEQQDFISLSQRIGQKTGGIRQSALVSARVGGGDTVCRLLMRGKATLEQSNDLLGILQDVLLTVKLDNRDRFRQMAQEEKARMEARIGPSGSVYVARRLRAYYSEADWVSEQMGGISYLFFLRELVNAVENDWTGVLARLEKVRALAINRASMLCNVTVDAANWTQFRPRLAEFIAAFPAAPLQKPAWDRRMPERREGLTVPGQVNYVGLAANLYDLGYRYDGSSMVALNHLETSWLWDKVRKEGGAYGVHCGLDLLTGVFAYTSYRDPNLLKTLQNFAGSSRFLRELDLNERELTRAIIGVIGDLDAYQLPDAKGYSSMVRTLCGITDEARQQRRDEVLSTTMADFRAFAEVLEQVNAQGLAGVVGAQANIEAANRDRPGLFEIVKVL
jgi:Zn-dependent M16 (insulinase) family peptidase